MKKLFFFILAIFPLFTIAQNETLNPVNDSQQLSVSYNIDNLNDEINNSTLSLDVSGGKSPYKYYWDKEDVDTLSYSASELCEGSKVKVVIVDSLGSTLELSVDIPTSSGAEKINGVFKKAVDGIGIVLFWDPFASMKIYDPIIYDENNNVLKNANGTPKKNKIPFIVIWLIFGALFFTIKMRFINFTGIKHSIQLVAGKFTSPAAKGEVSHFQALTTALSATVGLGNIAGVAIAMYIGGPGATFWMVIAGLIGMTAKFVECTLGVKYRKIDENGEVSGGPMYYIKEGLRKKNMKGLGVFLSILFSILVMGASFGGGNMFQANQAFSQMANLFPSVESSGLWFGVILAILVGAVIIGGIKSIAKVTNKIVPLMAGVYIIASLIIIFANISQTGEAFSLIFNGAFSPEALKGGFIGVFIVGFQRAAFSNEAGVGSAPIAHSAAKTKEPISEGYVALLEPFIDTVVICTMTALVIIFTGFHVNPDGLEGAPLTSAAFASVISWFPYVLGIAIFLFAFSTMISWSYYGQKGFEFLFGKFFFKLFKNKKVAPYTYKLIFLFFIVVGSSSSLGAVVDFSDYMVLGMAFPNVLALLILSGEVKKDLFSYRKRLKSGEIKRYK